ncbi:MAG TPA: hypothetical protein VIS06_08625 [Mycobacteriales bacterium]
MLYSRAGQVPGAAGEPARFEGKPARSGGAAVGRREQRAEGERFGARPDWISAWAGCVLGNGTSWGTFRPVVAVVGMGVLTSW